MGLRLKITGHFMFTRFSAKPFWKFNVLQHNNHNRFYCFYLFLLVGVYFVTRRHEKQIKCEQVSPQAAADFAKEKKALN